jgi:hypothetical protein
MKSQNHVGQHAGAQSHSVDIWGRYCRCQLRSSIKAPSCLSGCRSGRREIRVQTSDSSIRLRQCSSVAGSSFPTTRWSYELHRTRPLNSKDRPMPIGTPPGPVPTLGQLRRGSCWLWSDCTNAACRHRAPAARAPLIIRWGPDTSSDRLRRSARCTKCGGRGATLMHPRWTGLDAEFRPFPF